MAVNINPGTDIQGVVDANAAGTTYILEPGTHRLQSITPKDDDVFVFKPGAVLSGAKTLTGWTQYATNIWTVTGQTQAGDTGTDAYFSSGTPANVTHPEDLWVDGVLYDHADDLSDLQAQGAGWWWFDYANDTIYVYIADPAEHSIETSVSTNAFNGSADHVTISGGRIEKFASPYQDGAIECDGEDWSLLNVELCHNHSRGVTFGNRMRIVGCSIHHNGQIGVAGRAPISSSPYEPNEFVVLNGCEIAYNNPKSWYEEHEEGGAKIASTNHIVLKNNFVHDNEGAGLWCDADTIYVWYFNNIIYNNLRAGIKHEISNDCWLKNNWVGYNGRSEPTPTTSTFLWGAQIELSTSQYGIVENNVLVVAEDYGNGIGVMQQDRSGGHYHSGWAGDNNIIRSNTIIHLGEEQGQNGIVCDLDEPDLSMYWSNQVNLYENNTWYVKGDHPYWRQGGTSHLWAAWTTTEGQDSGSTRILTDPSSSLTDVPEWQGSPYARSYRDRHDNDPALIFNITNSESSGTTAVDDAGTGDGTHSNVLYTQDGIGDELHSIGYDPAQNSATQLYSAALADAISAEEFTLMIWAKAAQAIPSERRHIIRFANSAGSGKFLLHVRQETNGDVRFQVNSDSNNFQYLDASLDETEWVHYAIVVSKLRDEVAFYANGQEVYSTTGVPANPTPTFDSNILLGCRLITVETFEGLIAHARIWNRALTPTEIKTDYEFNQVPTITTPSNLSHPTGTMLSLQIEADDINEADSLTYYASGLPDGLTINALTGEIMGVPTSAGVFEVEVGVADDGNPALAASTMFTWTINTQAFATIPSGTRVTVLMRRRRFRLSHP